MTLNLVPGGIAPIVHVSASDVDSRTLIIKLKDGLEDFTPVGDITLIGSYRGGVIDEKCTISNDVVTVTLPNIPQSAICQIAIKLNEELIHTQKFVVEVEQL